MFRTQQFIRRGSIIGAASVAALVLASCSSAPDTADGGQTGSSDNPTVAFVAAQMTATYFQVMQCGAQAAADEFDVSLDWQGDPDWDLQTQTPLINAAVQSSPIGLVLVPTDPVGLIETVENISADMPVITVDGSLDEEVELQNIRTDNLSAGALAADALAKAVGEKGTVLVIASFPGVAANAERVDGFAERMAEKYPNIEVLPTEYSDADQATASQKAAAAITNPDLVGIYTTLAPASAGASAAIQAANKTGEVKLVAYDADPSQVADLKAGVYDALVAQDPYGLGYDSVKRIAQINDGSLDPKSLEYQEYVNAFIIDRDNADSEEAKRFIYVPTC